MLWVFLKGKEKKRKEKENKRKEKKNKKKQNIEIEKAIPPFPSPSMWSCHAIRRMRVVPEFDIPFSGVAVSKPVFLFRKEKSVAKKIVENCNKKPECAL